MPPTKDSPTESKITTEVIVNEGEENARRVKVTVEITPENEPAERSDDAPSNGADQG